VSTGYTRPPRSNVPFLISDTRALSERQGARVSEIKNGTLDPDGTEYFEM